MKHLKLVAALAALVIAGSALASNQASSTVTFNVGTYIALAINNNPGTIQINDGALTTDSWTSTLPDGSLTVTCNVNVNLSQTAFTLDMNTSSNTYHQVDELDTWALSTTFVGGNSVNAPGGSKTFKVTLNRTPAGGRDWLESTHSIPNGSVTITAS